MGPTETRPSAWTTRGEEEAPGRGVCPLAQPGRGLSPAPCHGRSGSSHQTCATCDLLHRGLVIIMSAKEGEPAHCIHVQQTPVSHSDGNQLTGVRLELKIIKAHFLLFIFSITLGSYQTKHCKYWWGRCHNTTPHVLQPTSLGLSKGTRLCKNKYQSSSPRLPSVPPGIFKHHALPLPTSTVHWRAGTGLSEPRFPRAPCEVGTPSAS